jgi:hypothetical protein
MEEVEKPQSYEEYREAIKEKQSNLTYEQIKQQMQARSDAIVELDNLPKQNHIWIDRGLKMTCEYAGHPWHETFKIRKTTV